MLVAVVDPPPSMASAHPSPSESKSKLLGIPSASVSVVHEIEFGNDVLVGINCSFLDNDGHNLAVEKRKINTPNSAPIRIGNNVFIGDNVTVLKGVSIGDNSVIGSGSIVTKSIPSNSIAAGNPAKVIRELN